MTGNAGSSSPMNWTRSSSSLGSNNHSALPPLLNHTSGASGTFCVNLPRTSGMCSDGVHLLRPRVADAPCERSRPFGDVAGAHADDHVPLGREVAEGAAEIVEVIDGANHAMPVSTKTFCERVGIDAFDRLLAGWIDRRHEDDVGVVEGTLKLLHQRLETGEAVRLDDRDDPPLARLRAQQRGPLGFRSGDAHNRR